MKPEQITIFKLEEIIKEEKLDELKDFIPKIKGSNLEQEFKRQYGTANLSNAIEHIIKNKTNKEVFELSFKLGLEYLEDRELGRLIKQTILSEKIDYYHHIKKEMDEKKFNSIQKHSFLTLSNAFSSFPDTAFYEWIKNVVPDQDQLENHIRTSVINNRMNINYLDSFLLKIDDEHKRNNLIYECLAYSSIIKTNSNKVCHLFNLILPEINKQLLCENLKKTLNIAESKDKRLETDNLEVFCEVISELRPGNMLVLTQLMNSYNLNNSLAHTLKDTEKKTSHKSPKI